LAQDYPLEELSPRAFEQLSVALGLEVLGNGLEAFGSGPDGGREATYTGAVNWSATEGFGDESWNGFVVLQAKQREHSGEPAQNLSWLRDQISDELDAWASPTSRRQKFPQYLIFITNVRLSSVPGSGGIDQINAYLERRRNEGILGSSGHDSLAARGLRACKVWHRDQINGLLTKYADIRHGFKGLLTVGDVLTRLAELGGTLDPEEFQPVMVTQAKRSLGVERWVNFSEAGGQNRQSVENIIIDLAVERKGTREHTTILREVFERADSVLKPSINPRARHLVLTGQPGSGKSTMTKFLTQMYRVAFTTEEALTSTGIEVRNGTLAALSRVSVPVPKNRRWPIRVNLAEYADAIGPSGDKTLLRWISERVSDRAGINILPNALGKWLKHWPCLVVLDGLDEVTAPEVRPRVLDEIRMFVEEADHDDSDLLVVVTTRPTGYTERLMPERFDQYDLRYLDEKAAVAYGRHITSRRLADDPETRDQIIGRFERHAADASMLRLMKTPLQVLIMTFILERFGTLPANKYELFSWYFDTLYNRESAKPTNLARFLADQRKEIIDLHERVGMELQIQAETSNEARSIMSKERLRELAVDRLREIGYDPGQQLDRIADRIVQATTDRLVLLVPAEDDGVSFEIRSLQELMAARVISSGREDQLRHRIAIAAPSPHWRNTLVFVAGRLFAEGPDHRRDLLLEVIEDLDHRTSWPGWICPIGPGLAANFLDDGLAANTPKWRRRMIDLALRALTGSVPPELQPIADGLSAAQDRNDRMHIRSALKTALAGIPRARYVANSLIQIGSFGPHIPGASEPPYGAVNTSDAEHTFTLIADQLAENVDSLELSQESQSQIEAILEELKRSGITDGLRSGNLDTAAVHSGSLPLTTSALKDEDLAAALDLLLGALLPERWASAAALGSALWPDVSRVPVGAQLSA